MEGVDNRWLMTSHRVLCTRMCDIMTTSLRTKQPHYLYAKHGVVTSVNQNVGTTFCFNFIVWKKSLWSWFFRQNVHAQHESFPVLDFPFCYVFNLTLILSVFEKLNKLITRTTCNLIDLQSEFSFSLCQWFVNTSLLVQQQVISGLLFLVFRKKDLYLIITQKLTFHEIRRISYGFHGWNPPDFERQLPGMVSPMFYLVGLHFPPHFDFG